MRDEIVAEEGFSDERLRRKYKNKRGGDTGAGIVPGGKIKKRVPVGRAFGPEDIKSGFVAPKGAEYVVSEAGDPVLQQKLDKLTPQQVALIVVWGQNGNNISAAGKSVGYNPSYARWLFSNHPLIKEAVEYLEGMGLEDKEWLELLPEARMTMRSLLKCQDPKVRYWAAKDIVDRAEGKPTIKIDKTIRDERPSLSDGQMQLAFSLMQARGMNFTQAKNWVLEHPEESGRWIAANSRQKVRQIAALAESTLPPQDVSDLADVELVEAETVEAPEGGASLVRTPGRAARPEEAGDVGHADHPDDQQVEGAVLEGARDGARVREAQGGPHGHGDAPEHGGDAGQAEAGPGRQGAGNAARDGDPSATGAGAGVLRLDGGAGPVPAGSPAPVLARADADPGEERSTREAIPA